MTDQKQTTPCTWTKPYEDPWETNCGNLFEIIETTPRENGMTFCCYCGAHIVEKIEQMFRFPLPSRKQG